MRKSLFTAAAAAPLLLIGAFAARAETTISGSQTNPVQTSTANNGQPDDVTVASGGSVSVSGPVALTLDSDNKLTVNGAVSIKDQDNSTTVLILGGHTGQFLGSGSIGNISSYQAKDTNNDGVQDGAFAEGTGRYGVRVMGPGAFVGDITAGSSITVQGNNSFGLSAETAITGNLLAQGGITVTGDNTTALRETGGVSGNVKITGGVSGSGANAVGVDLSGDIGGSLTVYSSVQTTGYRVTTRPSDPAVIANFLPENIQQSGSAMNIRADVAHGVFIGAPPAGTNPTDTTTDADKDGVVDSAEGIGALGTFGSAPVLSIGAAGRDVHLGAFGSNENAYGLIVRGTVTGDGVYDGKSATALLIGTGDGTVHLDGGARVVGSVTSNAFQADSTALHIGTGAVVPQLRNEGAIQATASTSSATAATAVQIDAGAQNPSLINTGAITAKLTGNKGSAYGVVDRSGTVSSVVNTGAIVASLEAESSVAATTGQTVALDLSANTTGVTLVQSANSNSAVVPTITGDILLGSGADDVSLQTGKVTGALDFGAGQGSLTIDGGAAYAGKLTSSGVMAVNINKGTLEDDSASTIQASSLTVGSQGSLIVTADPAAGKATEFDVAGPATLASGSTVGLHLASLPQGPSTFTVISSSALSVASTDSDLAGQTPYLFVTGLHADPAAGRLDLNIRRRTAAEAHLNPAETAAFDPIYDNLAKDLGIQRAFLAQTDQPGLVRMVDQMLPDYAGGVFRALSWASEQDGLAAGTAPLGQEHQGPTRAWTHEIVMHEQKNPAQATGYNILGFGAVGGLESVSPQGNALGVKFGFMAANITNPDVPSDNLLGVSELNAGVYWRGSFGGLTADAQLGAGYVWTYGRREFLFSDSTGIVHRTAAGNWSGYTLSARAGATYTAELGSVFFMPSVHADYFRLHESGYSERTGGSGYDLTVKGRSGDLLSVTGGVTAGFTFGEGFRWRPQIEAGYRAVVSGSAGSTTALFDGGTPFTLTAESIRKSAVYGRVGVRVYSDYLDLLLDAGAEHTSDYTDLDLQLTARTVF